VGATGAGDVQSQTDEPAVFKSLVAFGLMESCGQRQARGLRVHALGAVGQGVIAERAMEAQLCADPRVGQPFQAQETRDTQYMANHRGPNQISCGDVGMEPPVARSLEVGFQTQTVTSVVLDLTNVRPLQRGRCLRRSTSNSALAVRTSRSAS
jgi:hypothetical protein